MSLRAQLYTHTLTKTRTHRTDKCRRIHLQCLQSFVGMCIRRRGRRGRRGLTRALKIENSKWPIFPLDGIKTKSMPGVHYDMHRCCTRTVICTVSLQNAIALARTHTDDAPPRRVIRRVCKCDRGPLAIVDSTFHGLFAGEKARCNFRVWPSPCRIMHQMAVAVRDFEESTRDNRLTEIDLGSTHIYVSVQILDF